MPGFCIVQDDYVAKVGQLAAMASIYANAYFTIAASEGEGGDFGLPGLTSDSPRHQPFREFHFSPTCRMLERNPSFALEGEEMRYHTRGWTFQEFTLSRRLLVFHHQTVSWACQLSVQQENGAEPLLRVIPAVSPDEIQGLVWTRWPNLRSYLEMVQDYSNRDLSYSEDVLNAFDAFITVQGRAMKGGMLYGTPELFFGAALLWMPLDDNILERRTDVDGNVSKRFPSWSWTGWVGPVDMTLAKNAYNYIVSGGNQIPITDFHIIDFYKLFKFTEPHRKERVQDIHYHTAQGLPQDMDDDLLPGNWTFKRGVPLVEEPDTVPLRLESLYSPIIEFRTRRLFAHLSAHDKDKNTISKTLVHFGPRDQERNAADQPFILDTQGHVIGYLNMSLLSPSTPIPTSPIELICIGKMEAEWNNVTQFNNPGVEYLHRNCSGPCAWQKDLCSLGKEWTWRFYNVLWIEWENGVAERKAVGKVWTDDWDTATTEEVDVRLG